MVLSDSNIMSVLFLLYKLGIVNRGKFIVLCWDPDKLRGENGCSTNWLSEGVTQYIPRDVTWMKESCY